MFMILDNDRNRNVAFRQGCDCVKNSIARDIVAKLSAKLRELAANAAGFEPNKLIAGNQPYFPHPRLMLGHPCSSAGARRKNCQQICLRLDSMH